MKGGEEEEELSTRIKPQPPKELDSVGTDPPEILRFAWRFDLRLRVRGRNDAHINLLPVLPTIIRSSLYGSNLRSILFKIAKVDCYMPSISYSKFCSSL